MAVMVYCWNYFFEVISCKFIEEMISECTERESRC